MTDIERFWSKVDRSPGFGPEGDCWRWTGSHFWDGYGRFTFEGEAFRAHRFAYELEHGPLPAGIVVRHRCDNPGCVRPDHLEPGTVTENNRDCVLRGRTAPRKLSHDAIRSIRLRRNVGREPILTLAEEFGVSIAAICMAAKGQIGKAV